MKKPLFIVSIIASLLLGPIQMLAQDDNLPRFELGAQFSLMSRNRPTAQFDEFFDFAGFDEPFRKQVTKPGFGGRFTYNQTKSIAFEAEGNFFPNLKEVGGVPDGHIFQGQFGVKAGKRCEKFGIFGKLRPGFVTFTKSSHFTGFQGVLVFHPSRGVDVVEDEARFRTGKATYFSTDVGAVVEFYPSRRLVTRFDIGDTIIRYGEYGEQALVVCALCCPCLPQPYLRPKETKHNLQFSVGVGVRF